MLNVDPNEVFGLPEINEYCKTPCNCRQVSRWPEFAALFERLGVDLSRPYRRIVLDLDFLANKGPGIYLEQRGSDAQGGRRTVDDGPAYTPPPADIADDPHGFKRQVKVDGGPPIDTTSMHNREFRTCMPRQELLEDRPRKSKGEGHGQD